MRFAARRRRKSVEAILGRIDDLTLVRQTLREGAADADALEQNRLEIVRAQWDLSEALIERYLRAAQRAA
jgi:hypothetical protein